MVRTKVKLNGILHARPAANFVREAAKFLSNIEIECNQKTTNAKSILGVLALGGKTGDVVEITAEGPDEVEVIKTLEDFITLGCGENVLKENCA